MRKFFIAVAAILGILVVAALVAPFLIPLDWVKDRAVAQVEAATGRDLTIAGDVSLSILPTVQVSISDVSFSNRPGSDVADMATLSDLTLDVALMPLLDGELAINEFVLVDPVIYLETDASGTGNWVMTASEDGTVADGADTGGEESASAGREGMGDTLTNLRLGDVRIENGTVTYHDGQSGETTQISQLNVTLSLPDMASPFAGNGSLVYKDQTIDFDTGVHSLQALLSGQSSNARVVVESDPMTASFDGDIATGGAFEGAVELSIPSLRALATWLAEPLDENSPAPETVTVSGRLAMDGQRIDFTGAQIAADDLKASGDLGLDLSGARPYISADLTSDMLDLNPYLPQTETEQAAAEGGSGGSGDTAGSQPQGWSREPIDFSGLDMVNADLAFDLAGLKVRAIEIGRSVLEITVKDGSARLNLVEAQLYGGTGSAQIGIDRSSNRPAISNVVSVQGVAAEPLLIAAAGFDKLSGTGDLALDVTATGDNQQQLVESLKGEGAFLFRDGAFKGIDLAAMARDVSLDSVIGAASGGGSTDFAELSATFQISNGVARNEDLFMAAPLVRAAGKGNVNMPPQTLDYTLFLKPVANLQGQGASADEAGGGIPILVRGPWSDPSFQPDMEAIAKGLLSDPDAIGESLQNLGGEGGLLENLGGNGEGGGGLLDDLGGGDGGDAADAIKGLFD